MYVDAAERSASGRDELVRQMRSVYAMRFQPGLDLDRLVDQARAFGDDDLLTQVLCVVGVASLLANNPAVTEVASAEAMTRLDQHGTAGWDPVDLGLEPAIYNTVGNLALRAGQYRTAYHWYLRAIRGYLALSNYPAAAVVTSNVALVDQFRGRLGLSADRRFSLIELPVETAGALGASRIGLARIASADRRFAEAHQILDRVVDSPTTNIREQQFLLSGRLMVAIRSGDVEASRPWIQALLESTSTLLPEVVVILLYGLVFDGRFDEARAVLAASPGLRHPRERVVAGALRLVDASIALADGTDDQADEILEIARTAPIRFEDFVMVVTMAYNRAIARGDDRAAYEVLTDYGQRIARASRDGLEPSDADESRHEFDGIFEQLGVGQLNELYRERRELTGIIAHDLRGALQSVQLVGTMLERDRTTDPALIDIMRKSARQMTSILDTMGILATLDTWTMDGAKVPSERYTAQSVDQIVAAAVASTELSVTQRDQRIVIHDSIAGSRLVDGNPLYVGIVLTNLVSNASKYSPTDSTIEIHLSDEVLANGAAAIQIAVVDHGEGIAADDRDRIWQRYSRTAAARNSAVHGLGLGLYVAQRLTQRVEGTLELDTTTTSGTRFDLRVRTLAGNGTPTR